jgi:hypothetical protein
LALCCASTPPGSLVTTNPQTGKPLDPKSLRKHFALEIGIGAAEANFLVCRLFLATIQGAPPRLAQWRSLTRGRAPGS